MAGLWKIVVPEASTNYITNPVVGLASTGWAARGLGTVTRGSDYARWGIYSLKIVTSTAADTGGTYTEAGYSGATGSATISFYVYTVAAQSMNVEVLDGANNRGTTAITTVAGRWSYQSLAAVTLTNGNDIEIRFTTPDTTARTYYIGGLQIEAAAYATQFIYGGRFGCAWNGVYHASTSTRDAKMRLLGREVNLDSYSFYIDNCVGAGLQPVAQISEDFAQLPGAYHQATHYPARLWELSGTIEGSTWALLHTARKNLINVLTPVFTLDQEFSLVYTGGTYPVYINARLGWDDGDTGLQWDVEAGTGFKERLTLRLTSDDPFWYEDNQEIASLDSGDAPTCNNVVLRKAGDWQAVDAGVSGGGTTIAAIAISRDGRVYIGGDFTTAGGTTCNNVSYLRADGAEWTALGSGGTKGVNAAVYDIVCAPDLSIYIAGNFTAAGGTTAGYIVKYTQSTDTFAVLGPAAAFGADGPIYALAIHPATGYIYAGGNFANIGGVAADSVAFWNGTVWAAVSASTNGIVHDLVFDNAGNLYACGTFTSIGGTSANRIAMYNGSAWVALSTGASAATYALAYDGRNGRVYVGGDFTTLGGTAAVRGGYWNGTTFAAIDATGFTADIQDFAFAPDGTLWIAGNFAGAGGLTVSGVAVYNGARIVYPDIKPGTSAGNALMIDRVYNVWLGTAAATDPVVSGSTTVTSLSTTAIYPRIVSTGAQTLKWIENASTGQYARGIPGARLYLNHVVLDGETTTIDVERGRITSDQARPGLSNGLLGGSQNSRFLIYPGANTIYTLSSDATKTNILVWRTRHATIDGGA